MSESGEVAVIFDGDCGFCTTMANWIEQRTGQPGFVAPWQVLDLAEYGLTEADASAAIQWVGPGPRRSGADAIVAALAGCGPGWWAVAKLLGVPPIRQLARTAYPVIARNRHRLPGATDACRLEP